MENFVYYAPTRIYFGRKEEENVGKIIASYGYHKILLHYGKGSVVRSGLLEKVKKALDAEGIAYAELGGVEPNPKLSLVLQGIELCRKENVELILAVGGGSVIDSAKAISNGVKVDFSPWLFSIKEKESKDHLPVGTILTIAASGSDMSDSCVITNDTTWEKRGFSSPQNRALFSILDPELTYTVSPYQTACGVVDIMMHTLERYISPGEPTEITDNLALGLLKATYDAGRKVLENPCDYNARADLLWANSLSHNGLTGSGRHYLMSVHQLEHEVSGMFDHVAHGAGLAALYPSWALCVYQAAKPRFLRFAYEVMGVARTEDPDKDIKDALYALSDFYISLGMPKNLQELCIPESALKDLAWNAMFKGKRVLNDVVCIDYDKALEILTMAYHFRENE